MTYHSPYVKNDLYNRREWITTGGIRPFVIIAGMDLIEGESNDGNAKNGVKIVLRGPTDSVVFFDKMNEGTETTLNKIERQKSDSPPLKVGRSISK